MKTTDLETALGAIPIGLLDPLIQQFEEGLAEYRAGDWEKVGIKAGKFCEIAFTICLGHATGSYASAPSKPKSMFHDCQKLEQHNKSKGRSLCIQIPRVLIGLYELRNNRAIGHVSGEIDPNHMDAEYYLRGMKWVMAEFVRFFSQLPEDDSRAIVESVTARTFQIVWQRGEVRRILDPSKSAEQKVLILAYSENAPVPVADILTWSEYSNGSRMRKTVLKDLHKRALIHFSGRSDTVQILPTGQRYVEENGLLEQKAN